MKSKCPHLFTPKCIKAMPIGVSTQGINQPRFAHTVSHANCGHVCRNISVCTLLITGYVSSAVTLYNSSISVTNNNEINLQCALKRMHIHENIGIYIKFNTVTNCLFIYYGMMTRKCHLEYHFGFNGLPVKRKLIDPQWNLRKFI